VNGSVTHGLVAVHTHLDSTSVLPYQALTLMSQFQVSSLKTCVDCSPPYFLDSTPMLRIHNTLSGQLEEFRPLNEGEVRMYYCGPTVWDYGHIGNFRSAIAADVIRRYHKFKGYRVTQVMNLTDVDD